MADFSYADDLELQKLNDQVVRVTTSNFCRMALLTQKYHSSHNPTNTSTGRTS
jgi:hypothetical protein